MQEKVKEVRKILSDQFGQKIRIEQNILKVNTQEIDGVGIIVLDRVCIEQACGVKIKRSGTGLVIIVTV